MEQAGNVWNIIKWVDQSEFGFKGNMLGHECEHMVLENHEHCLC